MFGSITPEQRQHVLALRAALQSNKDYASLQNLPDMTSDYHLLRFLLARNFDLEKARKMFEDNLAWRREQGVTELRRELEGKPMEASSYPFADVFRAQLLGAWNSIGDAGRARMGDIVYIECMGKNMHAATNTNGSAGVVDVDKLVRHTSAFFEMRQIQLETLSMAEDRLVRTVQVRDVSHVSFLPGSGALAMIKRLTTLGMFNYPEIAGFVLFVSPPPIFAAVLAMVKVFIPADVDKKLRFLSGSGEQIPRELLKSIRPRNIEAWNRLVHGEIPGDDIQREILVRERAGRAWEEVVERQVGPRTSSILCYSLSTALPTLSWSVGNGDGEGSPHRAVVTGKLLYVRPAHDVNIPHDQVVVDTLDLQASTARLPTSAAGEALVVLILDNTSSWFKSHTFTIRMRGGVD